VKPKQMSNMPIVKLYRVGIISLLLASPPVYAAQSSEPLDLKPHHITVSVADLDRAIKWYEEKLGLKTQFRRTQEDPPLSIAWMKMPGFRIDLIQYKGSSKPQVPDNHLLMQGIAHIVFSTADVDHEYQLLKARGAHPSEPVTSKEFHNRTFYLRDSDGNYIEIYEEDPAKFK
jgi:catechol 2,3-dioxygenase-like lactoylglutathione lyase family enzyme